MLRGSQAPRRAVCGTRGSLRTMHGGGSAPSCCAFTHRVAFDPSIRVFSNESVLCIRWPKYWSFSFNISPSNEYSGLISFRMDWLDLLAVHRTLKSLLQHHSSKASILQRSAVFTVQPGGALPPAQPLPEAPHHVGLGLCLHLPAAAPGAAAAALGAPAGAAG